jgi:hypothetical protein
MTPAEVDALADDVYQAFVRCMQREAREVERASKRRR